MPGRNHTIEAGFLDELPVSLRAPAADLLHYYRLKQLLEMHFKGVDGYLSNQFALSPTQWQKVLDAVILTKVSYFEVTPQMSPKHINRLIKITAFALHEPKPTLSGLYKQVERHYPYFASWLKKVQTVREEILKIAKAKGRARSKA